MKLVQSQKIPLQELEDMAEKMFGNFVKVVVDIKQEIMMVDGELHADLEEFLLSKKESSPDNLWGINLHPAQPLNEWIEFDSMINFRPLLGNSTRAINDPIIQQKIIRIVNSLVER